MLPVELLLLLRLTPVHAQPQLPSEEGEQALAPSLLPSGSGTIQIVAVVSPPARKPRRLAVALGAVRQLVQNVSQDVQPVRDGLCQGKWGLLPPLEAVGCSWMFASPGWCG